MRRSGNGPDVTVVFLEAGIQAFAEIPSHHGRRGRGKDRGFGALEKNPLSFRDLNHLFIDRVQSTQFQSSVTLSPHSPHY